MLALMNDELIAHMKARVAQVRKIAAMAHDPKMIEMLRRLAEDGEADIRKLEAERGEAVPPPVPPPPIRQ
jgi:hypothetical protein